MRQRLDADDILQTVIRTFFRRSRDGSFEITGSATDDGPTSALTYCWEQFDKSDAQFDPITRQSGAVQCLRFAAGNVLRHAPQGRGLSAPLWQVFAKGAVQHDGRIFFDFRWNCYPGVLCSRSLRGTQCYCGSI